MASTSTTVVSPFDSRLGRARHTWRVIRRTTAVNFRARMEYRTDFALSILFGVVWQSSTLAFAAVLLTRFNGLGDFPGSGVLLIVGGRLTAHGLHVLLFDNFATLPRLVDEGRLDGYYLRPVSLFTQVLISEFNMNALGDIAVGLTTLGFAISLVRIAWTVATVLYLIAAIAGGMFIEAAVQTVVACALLRSPGSRALGSWLDEMMSTFGNYPLSILPAAVQFAFTFVLPLAFVAYLPAAVLLNLAPRDGAGSIVAHWSPVVGLVLFLIARRIWIWSTKHYRSVGG